MTEVSLTVSLSADIADARLAQLTQELGLDLSRAGVQARTIEAPAVQGDKGEPITLGVLVLALVTSGAVTAAIECFKAYLSRESALTIKVARTNGLQVEVTARNVDTPAVRDAVEAVALARSR